MQDEMSKKDLDVVIAESCLHHANAAGSMNVTVPDGLTWNRGFSDLTRRINAGWKTKELSIEENGWKYEHDFWVGPANMGKRVKTSIGANL